MMSTTPLQIITNEYATAAAPLESVVALCNALQRAAIRYCHWKSNNTIDKSAAGDKDLDLLIARADSTKFTAVLSKCGFKLAHAPAEKAMPGVLDYLGYDAGADKWVHVHAHYQLVVGHDFSKNYRIAIEQAYLASAAQGDIFMLPAPEFEFIVFVIRMVLKHSTWTSIISGESRLKPAERQEWLHLLQRVDHLQINSILERHLPYLGVTFFWSCVKSFASDASAWSRLREGHRLTSKLRAHARRTRPIESAVRLSRRVTSAVGRRIHGSRPQYRLGTGGAAIAIVGGDGAGKSTAVDGLRRWLSTYFPTTSVHLGKPAWSPATAAVRGLLKVGNLLRLYGSEVSVEDTLAEKSPVSPGYAWLIREVCRARDRYWTYVRARRRSVSGGIAIFDRFPLAQIELMDGPLTRRFVRDLADSPGARNFLRPRAESPLVKLLIQLEENYYKKILPPELLIVLRVDPDTAVQRKPDEQERYVRERSGEIWSLNWRYTGAHVIEASKRRKDVLAELKALIWVEL